MFSLLKTKGELNSMIQNNYFQKTSEGKFWYRCSPKLLFYFTMMCNPGIEDQLIEKYVQEPQNVLMFIQYNQNMAGFQNLQEAGDKVKRIFHIKHAYSMFNKETTTCNLLSIGDTQAGKSDFLEQMTGVKFEKNVPGSPLLFHDSVDLAFDSKENPMGFNLFDFQGKLANFDFELIRLLFDHLPNCYLLVQVLEKNKGYLEKLRRYFDGTDISDRIFVINKDRKGEANACIENFQRLFNISNAKD